MTPLRPRKRLEYEEARRLRAAGEPYKRIARVLGVSPATVVVWTRDIALTPEQHAHNLRRPGGPASREAQRQRTQAWSKQCRERRRGYQAEGRARARSGEPLHLMGCMLYWAEGRKARNVVQFSNSDPRMVRAFRRFLTDELGIDPTAIRLTLNVYTGNGLSVDQIERHWLELLELPSTCVRKHTLDHMPTSSSGRAKNKLPYGVCTLRVHSTRAAMHIFGGIQEYGDFEEPAWLD